MGFLLSREAVQKVVGNVTLEEVAGGRRRFNHVGREEGREDADRHDHGVQEVRGDVEAGAEGGDDEGELTDLCERETAFDGRAEIVVVGAPMSAVPYRSRLWSAADTNRARVVTWENFVLGRALKEDVDSLTSGETPLPLCSLPLCCSQIELRSTGDFIVRSNEIEKVYHRIGCYAVIVNVLLVRHTY